MFPLETWTDEPVVVSRSQSFVNANVNDRAKLPNHSSLRMSFSIYSGLSSSNSWKLDMILLSCKLITKTHALSLWKVRKGWGFPLVNSFIYPEIAEKLIPNSFQGKLCEWHFGEGEYRLEDLGWFWCQKLISEETVEPEAAEVSRFPFCEGEDFQSIIIPFLFMSHHLPPYKSLFNIITDSYFTNVLYSWIFLKIYVSHFPTRPK